MIRKYRNIKFDMSELQYLLVGYRFTGQGTESNHCYTNIEFHYFNVGYKELLLIAVCLEHQ
jgi:hypothetical protein